MGINFRFPRSGGGKGSSVKVDEGRTGLQKTFDGQEQTSFVQATNYDGGQLTRANAEYINLPLPTERSIAVQAEAEKQEIIKNQESQQKSFTSRNYGINFRSPKHSGGRFFSERIDEGRSLLSRSYEGTPAIPLSEGVITGSANLTLYLNSTGMTTTGGNIDRWNNAIGGQQIVSFTASAGQRPSGSTLNSLAAARFIRTESDLMTDTNSNGFLNLVNTSSYHCFIVVKPETITTTNAFIINDEVIISETNGHWTAGFRLSASVPIVEVQHLDKSSALKKISASVVTGETSLIEWWYDSSSISLRVNSGTVNTTTSTNILAVGATQMRLGRGTSASMSGVIGTIAVFNNKLDSQSSNDIRTYLAQTFNITTV